MKPIRETRGERNLRRVLSDTQTPCGRRFAETPRPGHARHQSQIPKDLNGLQRGNTSRLKEIDLPRQKLSHLGRVGASRPNSSSKVISSRPLCFAARAESTINWPSLTVSSD